MFGTLATLIALAAALQLPLAHTRTAVSTYQGSFPDGATYLIQVPSNWNGTLVLYSHGYVVPGQSNPAYDVTDGTTGGYLLQSGYALAGSSYASTGWAVAQALPDQIDVLDTFARLVKHPRRTIAWGSSMGGLITAGLVQQYPKRFDAALPMCGAVAGGVGLWNLSLDGAFAFNTLLAGGSLQVVNITDPYDNYNNAIADLSTAQSSPQGRARIALAAALADTPGWFDTTSPPSSGDFVDQEASQFAWFGQVDFLFAFYLRAELEGRAGGNPSFNARVDYRQQLAKSVDRVEVAALYERAGLSLDADLKTLESAKGIVANEQALKYLSDNIDLDGRISVPVLTLHTEGDGLVVNESESAYEQAIRTSGNSTLLRRLFIYRAGHCAFTPAEELAAFLSLVRRLDSGRWDDLQPARLNRIAGLLGSGYNPVPPAFSAFTPAPFLRTFNGPPP